MVEVDVLLSDDVVTANYFAYRFEIVLYLIPSNSNDFRSENIVKLRILKNFMRGCLWSPVKH